MCLLLGGLPFGEAAGSEGGGDRRGRGRGGEGREGREGGGNGEEGREEWWRVGREEEEKGGERGWGGRQEVKVNVHIFMFIHCGDMGNSTCTCVRQQFAQVEGPKRTALQVLTHTHTHTHTHTQNTHIK